MPFSNTRRWVLGGVWLAAVLLPLNVLPARAGATPFRVTGDLSAGFMVSADQYGRRMRYDEMGLGGSAGLGLALYGPLFVDVRAAYASFPSEFGRGALAAAGIGPSVEIDGLIRGVIFVPNATVNIGKTGDYVVPTMHLGLRAVFGISDEFQAGPEVSYDQVFWNDGKRYTTDARYFQMLGLAMVWSDQKAPPRKERVIIKREREQTTVFEDREPQTPPFEPSEVLQPASEGEMNALLDGALPLTRREEQLMVAPVLFEFNSTRVLPCGEVALFAAREAILGSEGEFLIEGHADERGTDDFNADLSLRRASWVHDWLVNHGVAPARLRVAAHGEAAPLEATKDEHAYQLHRRVTFRTTRVTTNGPANTTNEDTASAPACEVTP